MNIGRWIIIVGGFGFVVGFFGPMIFAPGANQGPLLGIFITGPLGILFGAGGWFLSFLLGWTYEFHRRAAIVCCGLIACGVMWAALQPKPEWPGRIYEIEVVQCTPAGNGESALAVTVLHEWQIKKSKSLFKPSVYSSGEITYARPTIVKNNFYISGACVDFPVGFTGKYFASNRPIVARDKAVLEPIPDFARDL